MKIKNAYKLIMVLAIALPAIAFFLLGIGLCRSAFYQMTHSEVNALSYTASKCINQYFSSYQTRLLTLSKMPAVITAASGDHASVKDTLHTLFTGLMESDENVVDVAIVDNSGIVVAAANETTVQQTFFAYNDETLRSTLTGSCYISDINMNNTYFENVIAFAVPVRDGGYLCEVIRAEAIYELVSDIDIFSSGYIAIIDSKGNTINYESKPIVNAAEITETPIAPVVSRLSEVNYTNEIKHSFNENGYFGAYGKLNDSGWYWIGMCTAGIVSSTVAGRIITGLCALAILVVICTVIAFTVYRKTIKPITVMTDKLRKIKSGKADEKLSEEIGGCYDFAVIANVFNSLLDDARISEEIHRNISELSENMLFEWNLDENRMYASDNFKAKFDIDIDNTSLLDGKFIDSLMSDIDAQRFRRGLSDLIKNTGCKDYYEEEFQIETKGAGKIWYCIKAKTITTRLGDIIRIIGVLNDINDKKMMSLQLSQRACYDFLSQLYNRSTFLCELQNRLDLKRANERLAVMFIDVDDFKFINDRYGHNVGDEVIKFVANTIRENLGTNGFAGRFGGDEFVIYTTNPEVTDNIDVLANAIIDKLSKGYRCETAKVLLNIKASIGISIYPDHAKTADDLVGAADEAMYFVKKNGKSNYHIFDSSDVPDIEQSNTII